MDYIIQPKSSARICAMNRSSQSGAALVIGMIGMVALLACAGMALDSGHMLINKTRLQNTADAAALHAAKVYDVTGDVALAQAAVTEAITLNGDIPGNREMKDAIASGGITVSTQFSNTLVPFSPGTLPARFIRVTMNNFQMPTFLVRIVGVNTLTVAASAIAGPSPSLDSHICDIAPVMLCGEEDTDPDDDMYYGYQHGAVEIVKHGSGVQPPPVGPGNFQLVRLPNNSGGSDIRTAMAGGYEPENCLSAGDKIDTEPGNKVGPALQGLNTRFGMYQGPVNSSDYPPDHVTDEPNPKLNPQHLGPYAPGDLSFNYSDYQSRYSSITDCSQGRCNRRLMTVPVAKCDGLANGQTQVDLLGFACIYLVQSIPKGGKDNVIFTQIVNGCSSEGRFSPSPSTGPEPTKIILYKDPNNVDA